MMMTTVTVTLILHKFVLILQLLDFSNVPVAFMLKKLKLFINSILIQLMLLSQLPYTLCTVLSIQQLLRN